MNVFGVGYVPIEISPRIFRACTDRKVSWEVYLACKTCGAAPATPCLNMSRVPEGGHPRRGIPLKNPHDSRPRLGKGTKR
jgi:hypothetical protein